MYGWSWWLVLLVLVSSSRAANLEWFGFYGGNTVTNPFTNLYQAHSAEDAVKAAHQGQKSLLYVGSVLWTVGGPHHRLMLRPDYATRIATLKPIGEALLKNHTLLGFNLGDELVWNCLEPSDLEKGANALRGAFPRGTAVIWYNEAAMLGPLTDSCHVHHPDYKIPTALDWFSVDIYHMDGVVQGWVGREVRGYYEKYIYPHITSDQQVLLVPGSFGSNVNHYPNGTYVCDKHCYDVMCAHDAGDFFTWGQSDPKVVAIAPWNWGGCPTCNGSHWTPPHTCCMDEIGTKDQPLARAAWEKIGKAITHRTD